MDRDVAGKVVAQLLALDNPLNETLATIELIMDEDLRRLLRRATARILGSIYSDVILEIGTRYPELIPTASPESKVE